VVRGNVNTGSLKKQTQLPNRFANRFRNGRGIMSIGLILIIILVIFLLGGFSGRFGGYGYGYGHSGIGVIGVVVIILVVLLLMGRI
jgi:Na+/melibiose symporter-like transporter